MNFIKNIANALTGSSVPEVFYGLHFAEGVAEYKDPLNGEAYRIFVGEETMKRMDPTYAGKPVFVNHVDDDTFPNPEKVPDGYVAESFYNKTDGKHWVKFIVVSDEGKEAIKRKFWKLSNAYTVKDKIGGGEWHGVEYEAEVINGDYGHLAIVEKPRYNESIILTPEEFKAYNAEKEAELLKLANSKDENKKPGEGVMFFKKSKVENSKELEGMMVTLPKSKKEVSIKEVVNMADEKEMENTIEPGSITVNGDNMVDVDGEKMTVNELVSKYKNMCKKKNGEEEDDVENMSADEIEAKNSEMEKELENTGDEDEEKKENKKKNSLDADADAEAKRKEEALANFNRLKNAKDEKEKEQLQNSRPTVELSADRVARGKSRYGS